MKLDRPPSRQLSIATAAMLALWAVALAAWLFFFKSAGWCLLAAGGVLPVGVVWWLWARAQAPLVRRGVFTGLYIAWWPVAMLLADAVHASALRAVLAQFGTAGLFCIGLLWAIYGVERAAQHYLRLRREGRLPQPADDAAHDPPSLWWVTGALVLVTAAGVADALWGDRLLFAWTCTTAATVIAALGLGGLWLRWAWRHPGVKNPLDLEAWYYGRENKKLSQSLATLGSYSLAFALLFLLVGQMGGCDIYEMPAGGGGGGVTESIPLAIRVKKVIKKKYVINPFSAILFNPPPIDDVKLELEEITEHLYTIGQGSGIGYGAGDGSGFAGGTFKGKVRFIRLEYVGDGWQEDMGIGGDQNLIMWYAARTGQKVSEQTESRTVGQLAAFPVGKSPPVVYMTGKGSVSLSKGEIKTLREYLTDKHGMLFADNGGGYFHGQFFNMMAQVLPNTAPVKIPLDDVIHRVPFGLPFLPYVAPHGGREAWGWKVDGRWVCYYHPGDIGDAWTDDHSGVAPEVHEACYALGTNIIFYAHVEYSKWLSARQQ